MWMPGAECCRLINLSDNARQGMNALANRLHRMNPALSARMLVASPIHRALLISLAIDRQAGLSMWREML
jgi:hypothetical protein